MAKTIQFLKKAGAQLFLFLIAPKSKNEDKKRREYILNILLLSMSVLTLIIFSVVAYNFFTLGPDNGNRGFSPIVCLIIFLFFSGLLALSRKGFSILSACLFIIVFMVPVTNMLYKWGADVPEGWLLFALLIVMSGILVNSLFAYIITGLISVILIGLAYYQINITAPNLLWKNELSTVSDGVVAAVTCLIIAIVSWLANRETEKSLKRARHSEAELKKERDQLEIKIEERTRDLKKAQIDRVIQLYRFAEFGRLSSGFFHDLANPLTAVSLSLGQIRDSEKVELTEAKESLQCAISAAKRMENFITAIRKQIKNQGEEKNFSLTEEITEVIGILSYKASKAHVQMDFQTSHDEFLFGDPVKFCHIITNVISNAIDSYDQKNIANKKVDIKLFKKDKSINLSIEDHGCGIAPEKIERIFDSFYSTKQEGLDKGMGIGLSSSKSIMEKYFEGQIEIKSKVGEGSIFTLKFPIKQNAN